MILSSPRLPLLHFRAGKERPEFGCRMDSKNGNGFRLRGVRWQSRDEEDGLTQMEGGKTRESAATQFMPRNGRMVLDAA